MQNTDRITSIEQLAASYANSIKGYKLVTYYKAAFPVYRVNGEIILQRKKELGLIQEFCLKYIRAGAKNTNNLMNFLGLDEKVIISNILSLHQLDMINYRFATKEVTLTSKGIDVLEKNKFMVPETIDYTFLIDGVTGEYQINERLDKGERVRNIYHLIPFIESKPETDSINLNNIKVLVNHQQKLNNSSYLDGDILAIKNIDKIEKVYRKLNVLVFANERGDFEIQVYDINKRVQHYETKLMTLASKKLNIIPTVEYNSEIDNKSTSLINEIEIREKIEEVNEIEETIKDIKRKVIDTENVEVETEEEYISKTMLISELKKQLELEKQKIAMAPKILNTYEHRPILIKALREAKSQVVIVSPWIKGDATDFELRSEIKNAMIRKVKVVICYGIGKKIDNDVKQAVDLLNKLKEDKSIGKYLSLIKLGNTHEKVLVCDNKFTVITSFNWLSFKGDPKRGFRQETGSLLEGEESSNKMLSNLQQRIIEANNRTNIII